MKKVTFGLLKFFTKKLLGTGIGRVPGVMPIYNFIYKLSTPGGIVLVNYKGNKMYVDADDAGMAPNLLVKGTHELF